MNNIFQQILQLLVTSPGNLIYHLVLAFALMAGLQAVINVRQPDSRVLGRRYLLGFIILLAGQVLLFVSSALVWQKIADPQQFLPVFDRAITAISFLWIAWMWAFPQPNRTADTVNLLATLALIVLWGVTLVVWIPQVGTTSFNLTFLDKIWSGADLVIVLVAIGCLFYRRQGSWGLGLGFFLILLIGSLGQLLWFDSSQDFAPIIRLAQLCVYPLLPTLARNLPLQQNDADSGDDLVDGSNRPSAPRKRFKVDSRTILSWVQVANLRYTQEICPEMMQAVGRSLTADLCFLMIAPDKQTAILQCGYDLIREESLPGSAIDVSKIPQIVNALQRSKPVRIPWSGKDLLPDLVSLAAVIGLKETGHLLAAPIKLPQVVWGGIILISPYSKYEWTKEDQSILSSICDQAASLLAPAFSPSEIKPAVRGERAVYPTSTSELDQVREEQKLLLEEIERLREQTHITPHQFEVEPLLAAQEESREIIQRLEADNLELREALLNGQIATEPFANDNQMNADLRTALDENIRIQTMLAEALQTIQDLQDRSTQTTGISGVKESEGILNVIQKIRQPIFSILGYADLITSESMGQLAQTTRIYLDRIKSSIDRMRTLLDEYNVSSFETSPVELAPQEINLNDILEQVLSNLSAQFREKKISLQVDISNSLPMVFGDRDALQQILHHLMQNAGAVTPPEGTIHICMMVDPSGQDIPYMLLQVTDEGGGIAAEDLSRVFTRKSIAEQGSIPGLGDNGLGLSITKTLVEAHGGRIWVDTDPGQTSTMTLLLPLHANGNNGSSKPT